MKRLAKVTSALIPLVGLYLSLATTPAQANTNDVLRRIQASGEIVLAHRESSIPFSYVPSLGEQPVGYALDLCRSIAKAVQKQLRMKILTIRYLPVTSSNRLTVIQNGQADLECGSTTNNAERRKLVSFTIPHFISGARFLVRSDARAEKAEDMMGKKIASTAGSTPLRAIRTFNAERDEKIEIVEVDDHLKGVQMVETGDAFGFVMDDVLLFGLRASRPAPQNLKVVGNFLTVEPLAIALTKDDTEFKKIVDLEMRRLILSKQIYGIYNTWFSKPIPPKNSTLNLAPSHLLKDFSKYPTDQVPVR